MRKTVAFLLLAIVILLGWEAYAIIAMQNATISEAVWEASSVTPLVPFLSGVLAGHLFFPKGKCVHCHQRPWA